MRRSVRARAGVYACAAGAVRAVDLRPVTRLLGWSLASVCAALAVLASGAGLSAQAVPEPWLLAPRALPESDRCATGDDRARQLGVRPLAFVPDGRPGSFVQDPPILTSDYNETVVLREFMVLGDVPTARFLPGWENGEVETWTRSEVRTVGGRRVSIFNPSWSGSQVGAFVADNPFGWDDGSVYWGEFLPGSAVPGTGWGISLRIAPRSLPPVTVATIAPDIQYSSHVVNIVLPDFGDAFLRDDHGFDLPRVSQRFFQEFQDTYDTLAIVPADGFTASYGAFHRNVKNDVRGIGLDVFDNSTSYGSASRRLRGAELYLGANFTRASLTSHELAHQWGCVTFDWTRLTALPEPVGSPSRTTRCSPLAKRSLARCCGHRGASRRRPEDGRSGSRRHRQSCIRSRCTPWDCSRRNPFRRSASSTNRGSSTRRPPPHQPSAVSLRVGSTRRLSST